MMRPSRLVLTAVGVLLLLLVAYVVAGPWLTLRGLDRAVTRQQYAQIAKYVDFPALRSGVKAQVEDRLARAYGERANDSAMAQAAMTLANQASSKLVDAMVTPSGLVILFEGNALVQRVTDPLDRSGRLSRTDDGKPPASPLASAEAGYESPTRFTAVARNRSGQPVVFVFALRGLRWKLVNIELPPE